MNACDTISATSSAATGSSLSPGCGADEATTSPLMAEAGSWTRAGRKRRRDKQRARRQARTGENAGGSLGAGAPSPLSDAWGDRLSRADLVDLRKAIRRDWPIPRAKRLAFIELAWQTFQRVENIPRHSIAVATTFITMSEANQRRRLRVLRAVAKLRESQTANTATDTPVPP